MLGKDRQKTGASTVKTVIFSKPRNKRANNRIHEPFCFHYSSVITSISKHQLKNQKTKQTRKKERESLFSQNFSFFKPQFISRNPWAHRTDMQRGPRELWSTDQTCMPQTPPMTKEGFVFLFSSHFAFFLSSLLAPGSLSCISLCAFNSLFQQVLSTKKKPSNSKP
jgi:hypothetical protein